MPANATLARADAKIVKAHSAAATENLLPSAYHMRRKFKMRDPYSVNVARNWAYQMAMLECCLCTGVLFCLLSICFYDCSMTDDDDALRVAGVDLTKKLRISDRSEPFAVILEPFFYKGVAAIVEMMAIFCACHGVCIAAAFNWKFLWCGEKQIMQTLFRCSGASVLATLVALVITVITLFVKWRHAMGNDMKSSLLVMSFYGFVTSVLFCLRTSTVFRSQKALVALNEELVTV